VGTVRQILVAVAAALQTVHFAVVTAALES